MVVQMQNAVSADPARPYSIWLLQLTQFFLCVKGTSRMQCQVSYIVWNLEAQQGAAERRSSASGDLVSFS